LWLCIGGEEPVRFVKCDGEELWPLGKTEAADAATIYKIEMAAEAIASGTPSCTKRSVQCSTVKGVRLDADNGANDVRAILDDCSVLADSAAMQCSLSTQAAEANEGRDV